MACDYLCVISAVAVCHEDTPGLVCRRPEYPEKSGSRQLQTSSFNGRLS